MTVDWKGVFPRVRDPVPRGSFARPRRDVRAPGDDGRSGVTGLVMLGSLGENLALTREEKREVVRAALRTVDGRMPVLGSVAEPNTEAAGEWARELETLGAQGAMVMPAMAFRPDREETQAHYLGVARATGLPIMVYNNPLSYHADVTRKMFKALSGQENLVAIKESSGDPRRITDVLNAVGDRYALFAGVDDLAFECAALGAVGWVAGIGLAFPRETKGCGI